MNTEFQIIQKPLITEKGTGLTANLNTYVFRVEKSANRHDIKYAIEKLFKVKVEKVRTMIVRGKTKTVRRSVSRESNWKKAYVTLAQGNKIEIIQGV
ncbi:MAG TPA: 50S ribosomal protein L23 [Holosporales bacterium]|nr:MAG: 50S ribosomal protein L23 [Deltaproteobacteria bacterium GWA2_38_16]OGQ03785.1 MAG: 50S ribosomal protein L23 [Deltaproteobacteria bacterium RIFCSPHIGHO2_02_FULL_38_15]OGQ59133.1 MAG: 50S ribosomal protein L23 [Deltaproteobacteria bacterium RIFCSPLOWO2_12_FULL_38_8]HBQ20824.1 50S ribosomal protein L23 [Deltaproteobacteria bacterium]HCC24681.1 50S ribosomal protein L23 [Holosporales bacterium]